MSAYVTIPSEIITAIEAVSGQRPVITQQEGLFPLSQEIARIYEKTRLNMAIGTAVEDGCIFAGISPDTKKKMYIQPSRPKTDFNFQQARKYAKKISNNYGVKYRLPTKNELNVIFNNSAVIGGFAHQDPQSNMSYYYWSSATHNNPDAAFAQNLDTGFKRRVRHHARISAFCIRNEE